jgi:hypothetical protein
MAGPSLTELEEQRTRLYAQLAATADFRRGSVTENYRKCGKPNCAWVQLCGLVPPGRAGLP